MVNYDSPSSEQQSRLQTLFNTSPDAIILHDIQGAIYDVNEQTIENLGYTREQLLSMGISEIDVKYDQEELATLWAGIGYRERETIKGRHRRADGSTFPVEISIRRIDVDGEERFITLSRDITERKEMEDELRRREERFRRMFESHSAPMLLIAPNTGAIQRANAAASEFYGYSVDALTSMDIQEINQLAPDAVAHERARAEREDRNHFVFEHELADGEIRTVEVHSSPLELDEQRLLFSIIHDITERKEREQKLEQYEALVESADDVFWMFDTDFSENLVINGAYEQVLGQPPTALDEDATAFRETVHPDDRERLRRAMERLQNDESIDIELRVNPRGEFGRWLWVKGTPVYEDEKRVGFAGFARDITERKEREEELNRLKERLELAVEGANLGVWDWDMITDEVEFNEQWAAMLGYSVDELESHLTAWEKRVHPDDHEAVRDALDAHIEGETDYYDTEHRLQTADGDWKWIRDVGKISERDDDGQPTRAVGIHIDISDRKRHEQQIQALHAANRRLIDARSRQEVADIAVEAAWDLLEFSVPSMWYTTNGEIEMVANSEEHQKLVEAAETQNPTHSPDSWLWDIMESGETTVRSPLPPDDLAADVPLHSAIILPLGEEGVLSCAARGEVEFTDRQVRIAEILARNVQAALDQLDQRMALERQQQFTDDLLDAIEDVVYVLDTKGDFIEWNRAFEAVTGYGGDQIDSMNATDVFSDDDAEAVADAVAEAFETGRTRIELEFLTADGESIPYEFVAKSFEDPDGEPVVAGIGRDRRLHLEYERTLEEQRDNLEVLNQGVRHDIRNDMTVIRGRAEMLEEHVDDAGREHLDAVLTATKSAIELTTVARDLAETMLSSQEDVGPVRLDDHLRETIENARAEFQDAVITIEEIPDVRVQGNELLEALFRNLLHNAVVHNDKQTPTVQISTTVDTETCRVAVADNGPGIPDDQTELIFGKGETGLDSPGTGIGLYLVQTLVEQYGGAVWVEDNDPDGSVFVVELPIAE